MIAATGGDTYRLHDDGLNRQMIFIIGTIARSTTCFVIAGKNTGQGPGLLACVRSAPRHCVAGPACWALGVPTTYWFRDSPAGLDRRRPIARSGHTGLRQPGSRSNQPPHGPRPASPAAAPATSTADSGWGCGCGRSRRLLEFCDTGSRHASTLNSCRATTSPRSTVSLTGCRHSAASW
jgi:hypothetical protein